MSAPPAPPAPPAPQSPVRPDPLPVGVKIIAAVLLLIPCAALAAVPLYSHESPRVAGWPFFYWYQVLWVLITPLLTYAAHVVIKRARAQR